MSWRFAMASSTFPLSNLGRHCGGKGISSPKTQPPPNDVPGMVVIVICWYFSPQVGIAEVPACSQTLQKGLAKNNEGSKIKTMAIQALVEVAQVQCKAIYYESELTVPPGIPIGASLSCQGFLLVGVALAQF